MAYKSPKAKRQAKDRRKAILYIAISFSVLISFSFLFLQLKKSRIELDPETLCPVKGPNGVVAILIDSTDPFSHVQKEFLTKYFDELEADLGLGYLVQIYSASSYSDASFEPVANLCNPGDGTDANIWTENPERIRRKWANSFDAPLTRALLSSIDAEKASASPLMSMIKALSIKAFPINSKKLPLKLYIVSDMLEHTATYSQYSGNLEFDEISQQAFFSHLSPNLNQVEVTVLYIARPGAERLQTKRHAEFWAKYFQYTGAFLQIIKRI